MSELTWCQLVQEACRRRGVDYAAAAERLKTADSYRTARRMLARGAGERVIVMQIERAIIEAAIPVRTDGRPPLGARLGIRDND